MPEFRYTGLEQDVVQASLQEIQNGTWLIYPTQRSCREAQMAFQKQWQPLSVRFLSMDQFKQNVIFSGHICLQDEKRLVCLFQAMTAEDRAVFHIEKYPDLIDWGQHFFDFFEDLAEEGVDANALLERMEGLEFNYQVWQLENYTRMLAIRQQYLEFITAKGFTDAISDLDIANLHLPAEIKRFVFVNQFYYSRLEKSLIGQLEKSRSRVIIMFQGVKGWLTEQSLTCAELDLNEAFPAEQLPFRLKVRQYVNAWQMALGFLQDYAAAPHPANEQHFIIDATFLQAPYNKVFDRKLFQTAAPDFLYQTRLGRFWQTLGKGVQNLIRDEGRLLVRLDWLLQAVGEDGFVSYFRPDWTSCQIDKFTAFLCYFSDNNVLYLDTQLKILDLLKQEKNDPEASALLKAIMALLAKLAGVGSLQQLADVIDLPEGVRTYDLLSDEEKESSNLTERFYEALANFLSMDELALVQDWQVLYPGLPVGAGIVDLFLTFIKPRTYTINRTQSGTPAATVTNLMDTRNLQADKVTFLNLVEGVLPGTREDVWLFNEKQRQTIGLKSWDVIRSWERYYFYRIIASASEVELYTIENQDKAVEPSSFLSELLHLARSKSGWDEDNYRSVELPADLLLTNWLPEITGEPLAEKIDAADRKTPEFFNLPFDKTADFGKGQQLSLSWTACDHFLHNPLLYYLRDLKRVQERTLRLEDKLNRKMFGILLHNYLMTISQRLAEQHQGVLSMDWEWISKAFLTANLKAALADPWLVYQLPRNYNRDYLRELLTPFLIDTASWFFRVGLANDPDFQNAFIKIIPEEEQSSLHERTYKLLVAPETNPLGLGIAIRGRADLRLETHDKRFIIDFKTGEADKLQLLFYAWFYYLIEHPNDDLQVRTGFYRLLDKRLEWTDIKRTNDPAILHSKILEALAALEKNGYAPPTGAKARKYFIEITRADLLKNLPLEEEGE